MSLFGTSQLAKSPSSASLSTRVTSTDSLPALEAKSFAWNATPPELRREKLDGSQLLPRHRRLFLFGLAALACTWWSRHVIRMSKSSRVFGPTWIARVVAAALSMTGWCLGVRGIKDVESAPSKVPDGQAMLCLHPHGLCGIGPLLLHGNEPRRKGGSMEHVFILAADAVFNVPILREVMLFINARAATAQVVDDVLSTGASVAVFPGGIHEQLRTDPSQEKLSFPPNLGFVRQAIKHGVPLVPLYSFGENQQFDVPRRSWLVTKALKEQLGIGVPFGVGRWGLPFLPKAVPLQCRLGRPIDVGTADANPSDERVKSVFCSYVAELQRLFAEHKDDALPPRVAARGLKITWRGHEGKDLTPAALADTTSEATQLTQTIAKGSDARTIFKNEGAELRGSEHGSFSAGPQRSRL